MDLQGRVAIVTGGRRGIGRSIALAMARAGADTVVTDISQEDCEKVAREIESMGRGGLAVKCDVSSLSQVEALVKAAVSKFGKVDILVNNAGILGFKPFLELSEDEWDRMISVNLKGQFLCAQATARDMVKRRWGRIINIASVSSGGCYIAFPLISHYTAAKGGVIGLTKALALELGRLGINVNAICPGAIETPMTEVTSGDQLGSVVARIPRGRLGRPEEVADLAVFLASEKAEYISGASIVIDGGWLSG